MKQISGFLIIFVLETLSLTPRKTHFPYSKIHKQLHINCHTSLLSLESERIFIHFDVHVSAWTINSYVTSHLWIIYPYEPIRKRLINIRTICGAPRLELPHACVEKRKGRGAALLVRVLQRHAEQSAYNKKKITYMYVGLKKKCIIYVYSIYALYKQRKIHEEWRDSIRGSEKEIN